MHGLQARSVWNLTGPSQTSGVFPDNNDHNPSSLPRATPPSGPMRPPAACDASRWDVGLVHLRTTAPSVHSRRDASKRLGRHRPSAGGPGWSGGNRHPPGPDGRAASGQRENHVLGSDGVSTHRSIGIESLGLPFVPTFLRILIVGGRHGSGVFRRVVVTKPRIHPLRGGSTIGPRRPWSPVCRHDTSLHPTAASESGAGELNSNIQMVHRTSLASTPAYEVRRGWSVTERPSPTRLESALKRVKTGPCTPDGWTC